MEKDLTKVKADAEASSLNHGNLPSVVGSAYDTLQVAQPEGTNELAARAVQIVGRVHELERHTLRAGVNRSFMIARSHYENIDLEWISLVYTLGYRDDKLKVWRGWWSPFREA